MTLVLATENRNKAKEIREILQSGLRIDKTFGSRPLDIKTLADFPDVKLPPETGATYRENATQKAQTVAKATGYWALADDSGLEIDALNGAPGVYSARFAGEGCSYADNRRKALDLLGDLPDEKRGARFVCAIALASPEGRVEIVESGVEGRIARSESGEEGFGYDPIFFLPEYRKTFAELSPEDKNKMSHRGRAVRAAMEILKKEFAAAS